MPTERLGQSAESERLVTFYIDLDEVNPLFSSKHAVTLYRLRSSSGRTGRNQEGIRTSCQGKNMRRVAQCELMNMHETLVSVLDDAPHQVLRVGGIGFETDDLAARADEASCREGHDADVRSDVHERLAGRKVTL